LLVPQFISVVNTEKGNRPSFAPAAPPEIGLRLFGYFQALATANQ
jgi:D-aminoacyl-tRNA deacylase